MHDGDVLQIGGSSRIYRLHWIPLSRAYGYDNPFLPRIEESDTVEEKEEIHQVRSNTQKVYCSVGVGCIHLVFLIPKFKFLNYVVFLVPKFLFLDL